MEGFRREKDGTVERVRQTAVTPTNLHGDDNKLGKGFELARKRRVDVRIPQGKTNGTVGRNNFEENGKESECIFVGLRSSVRLFSVRRAIRTGGKNEV